MRRAHPPPSGADGPQSRVFPAITSTRSVPICEIYPAASGGRFIIVANSREEKVETLTNLRDTVEELKVVITLCKEIKAFKSFATFQTAAEAAVNLGKQSEGWLRSTKQVKGTAHVNRSC